MKQLLDDATIASGEIVKSERSVFRDGISDVASTVAGIAINMTPVGFISNLVKDAVSIGQGLSSALGAPTEAMIKTSHT